MNRQTGFTLVELMITLVIAAILLTIGIPSFRDFIMNNRLISQSNEFAGAINLARSAAIKQQRNAYITSSAGTNWASGWTVWVDNDRDNTQDTDEVLRVTQAFTGTTTFTTASKTQFRYSPSGLVDSAGTLTLCNNRTGERGRRIDVGAAGRINIQAITCP